MHVIDCAPRRPAGNGTGAARVRPYELVVMAASAGGLPVVRGILAALPADFPLPVVLLQHRSTTAPEPLPRILARTTALRVKSAESGEELRAGTVYVAPPDRHLVVAADRTLHLVDGTRIRFLGSSAEPLFESAAYTLDGHVIAVVLTGGGADGTHGVLAVKAMGGTVIAQDPATAEHPSMPRAAIATGAVDQVLDADEIAPALLRLARVPPAPWLPFGGLQPTSIRPGARR